MRWSSYRRWDPWRSLKLSSENRNNTNNELMHEYLLEDERSSIYVVDTKIRAIYCQSHDRRPFSISTKEVLKLEGIVVQMKAENNIHWMHSSSVTRQSKQFLEDDFDMHIWIQTSSWSGRKWCGRWIFGLFCIFPIDICFRSSCNYS